ncbi:MAG: hypothetical protein ACLFR2_03385 [Candidatus Kapaibacterium sp.]
MKTHIIILILALSATFVLGYIMGEKYSDQGIISDTIIIRDTVVKYKQRDPMIIKEAVPKLVYHRDTLLLYKPFTAILDTIVIRDTVQANYKFPENKFSLFISHSPDTLVSINSSVLRELPKKDPWWEKPLLILSGTLAGYLIGNSK